MERLGILERMGIMEQLRVLEQNDLLLHYYPSDGVFWSKATPATISNASQPKSTCKTRSSRCLICGRNSDCGPVWFPVW